MIHRDARPLLDRAIGDLRERTLAAFDCEMAKLIYLSSTRDYNTGCYRHEGLEFCYSSQMAEEALERSHRQVFKQLATAPLQHLVDDLQAYFRMAHADGDIVLRSWMALEPYRVVPPEVSEPLLRELFISNVKAALAILESRRRARLGAELTSSPQPSRDQ